MPKILVAPTAFKGTMSPVVVASAITSGLRVAGATEMEIWEVPLADGGDGTVECLHRAIGGELWEVPIATGEFEPTTSPWLKFGNESLVELASACGIAKFKTLKPMTASTRGLGLMIQAAHDHGSRNINVALGGSASTDGGAGALQAMGAEFIDFSGATIPIMNGERLGDVARIDLSKLNSQFAGATFQILTDVENPLFGPDGAAHIFGPQKGASNEQVARLDSNLRHFAARMQEATGRSLCDRPGAGAAGGTAFGLASTLHAQIRPGFEWVAQHTTLEQRIQEASLVITGEGKFDSQSGRGKVIGEIIKLCAKYGKTLWVVAATVDLPEDHGVDHIEKLIICQRTQGLCSAADLTRTIATCEPLHNFFTTRP